MADALPSSAPALLTDSDVLLSMRGLRAGFSTDDGFVRAVDGVSFDIERGEVLAIVGESGSGKSVTAMSILGLQPTLEVAEGEILWKDRDLLTMTEAERREIRGGEIAMIFQDPLTALNPVHTVGRQIGEMARIHEKVSRKAAFERAVEMLDLVRNEMFDVGADLATPLVSDPPFPPLRIEQSSVDRIEGWCDELSEGLPNLRSFILPGGSPAGAQLHVARTVCRRAERVAWHCVDLFGTQEAADRGQGGVNLRAVTYLNRLSDLLFIMTRVTNGTEDEVLWVPGTDRPKPGKR